MVIFYFIIEAIGGIKMENYLTWDDFKRLINGSFYLQEKEEGKVKKAFLLNSYMSSLFPKQYNLEQYEQKVQQFHQAVLDTLPALPPEIKKILGHVSLYQKEDGIHFKLDVNLFLQGLMYVCDLNFISDREYIEVANLYYNEDKERFINQIKEILQRIKKHLSSTLLQNDLVVLLGRDGKKYVIERENMIQSRSIITWAIHHLEEIFVVYEKEIPNEILDLFYQEKLLLLLAQSAINLCFSQQHFTKEMYSFLQKYCYYVQYRMQEDPHFNPSYIVKNSTKYQKAGIVTAKEVLQYLTQNKREDIEQCGFSSTQEMLETCLVDLNAKLKLEEEEKRKKQRLASFKKDMQLSWEFLPTEKRKEGSTRGLSTHYATSSEKRDEEEKKEKLLEDKIALFQNLPYITILRGVNHLEGYVAYVFPNGKVIMEKFYKKTKKGLVPAYYEAIFVMSIEYFGELSKESKTNIRDFMKSKVDQNACVINHTKNFMHRVWMEVENMEYSDTILDYIEALVNNAEKPKNLVKS